MTTVAGETSAVSASSQPELHQLLDAGGLGVACDSSIRLRVDVDADAARAVLLRRGDRDPAVAAAEVVHDVAFVTSASASIRSTTSSGVGTNGARLWLEATSPSERAG